MVNGKGGIMLWRLKTDNPHTCPCEICIYNPNDNQSTNACKNMDVYMARKLSYKKARKIGGVYGQSEGPITWAALKRAASWHLCEHFKIITELENLGD